MESYREMVEEAMTADDPIDIYIKDNEFHLQPMDITPGVIDKTWNDHEQIWQDKYRELQSVLTERENMLAWMKPRLEVLEREAMELKELQQCIGLKFDVRTGTFIGGIAPYLSAGNTEIVACKAAVEALRMVAAVLEDKLREALASK